MLSATARSESALRSLKGLTSRLCEQQRQQRYICVAFPCCSTLVSCRSLRTVHVSLPLPFNNLHDVMSYRYYHSTRASLSSEEEQSRQVPIEGAAGGARKGESVENYSKHYDSSGLRPVAERTREFMTDDTKLQEMLQSNGLEELLLTWNDAIHSTTDIIDPKAPLEYLTVLHEFVTNNIISQKEILFVKMHNLAADVALGGWRKWGAYLDGKLAVELSWRLVQLLRDQQRNLFVAQQAPKSNRPRATSMSTSRLPRHVYAYHAKERTRLYHGLLLTVRRSTNISLPDNRSIMNLNPVRVEDAANMAARIFIDMKQEEDGMALPSYKLVHSQTYDQVMAMHALAGDVDSIKDLWIDCSTRLHLPRRPHTARYYEAIILALQNRFHDNKHNRALQQQIALEAWEVWRSHLEEYRPVSRSVLYRPLAVTLRRVLALLQEVDNTRTASVSYVDACMNHAWTFVDKYPECREMTDSFRYGLINSKGGAGESIAKEFVGIDGPKSLGILLQRYCQSKSTLTTAEKLLRHAEQRTLSSYARHYDKLLNSCIPYNILMKGYLKLCAPNDALYKIESKISHLEKIGVDYPQLLPDRYSYSMWIFAILNSTGTNRADEAEKVLMKMETSNRISLRPSTRTYTGLFDFWRTEQIPNMLRRARNILDRNQDIADASLYKSYVLLCRQHGADAEAFEAWCEITRIAKDGKGNLNMLEYLECCNFVVECLCRTGTADNFDKVRQVVQDIMEVQATTKGSEGRGFQVPERVVFMLVKCLATSSTKSSTLSEIKWILSTFDTSVLVRPEIVELLIQICGKCDDKHEAWETCKQILALVESYSNNTAPTTLTTEYNVFQNERMYTSLLVACSQLLMPSSSSSTEQEHFKTEFRNIFLYCAKAGLVSENFLLTLCRWSPSPNDYLRMTLQDPSASPNMSAIPWQWQRNVKK